MEDLNEGLIVFFPFENTLLVDAPEHHVVDAGLAIDSIFACHMTGYLPAKVRKKTERGKDFLKKMPIFYKLGTVPIL